jgi:hypothetical protein
MTAATEMNALVPLLYPALGLIAFGGGILFDRIRRGLHRD